MKCPVVYVAGALRTTGTPITHAYPVWMLESMGQQLFRPPSVAGWDWGAAWMSTNTMRQRFGFANFLVAYGRPRVREGSVKATLPPRRAYELAHAAAGRPAVSAHAQRALTHLAAEWFRDIPASWRDQADWRAESLQRALRHLLIAGPEAQLC